jgi:nucleotide-binding universal stress UspA family protein
MAMPVHVLAVVDGTEAGERALEAAVVRARDSQLTVATVAWVERTGPCCGGWAVAEWNRIQRDDAHQRLARARRRLAALGRPDARVLELEGREDVVLAAAATRLGCDVVVVPCPRGLAGRGGGRIARRLRREGPRDVVPVS